MSMKEEQQSAQVCLNKFTQSDYIAEIMEIRYDIRKFCYCDISHISGKHFLRSHEQLRVIEIAINN